MTYREGRAESTGLPAEFADAVLSAQAFHWFEPVATLREFHRILKPGGWTILMWNERDERDPVTAAYGDVIRTARDAAAIESPVRRGPATPCGPARFSGRLEQVTFHNQQALDEEGLLGRAFSGSYAPRLASEREAWADRLKAVFGQYQQDGTVALVIRRRFTRLNEMADEHEPADLTAATWEFRTGALFNHQ